MANIVALATITAPSNDNAVVLWGLELIPA
jgi:hypothetical protein